MIMDNINNNIEQYCKQYHDWQQYLLMVYTIYCIILHSIVFLLVNIVFEIAQDSGFDRDWSPCCLIYGEIVQIVHIERAVIGCTHCTILYKIVQNRSNDIVQLYQIVQHMPVLFNI